MSTLQCVGAEKVNLRWTRIQQQYLTVRYKTVSGGTNQLVTIYPENGGDLSWRWSENINHRKYIKIGTYVSGGYAPPRGNCGSTGYWQTETWFWEFEKNRPIEVITNPSGARFFGNYRSLTPDPNSESSERENLARAINEGAYQAIINSNGLNTPGTIAYLIKVAQCLPNNAVQYYYLRGLSAEETHTFRIASSTWNLIVEENGSEIYRGKNWRGGGANQWDEPTELEAEITFYPQKEFPRTATYTKRRLDTGVKFDVFVREDNEQFLRLLEVEPDSEEIIYIYSFQNYPPGVQILPYSQECVGCPPNTCSVDCGEGVCCYGSDGIAVTNYLK